MINNILVPYNYFFMMYNVFNFRIIQYSLGHIYARKKRLILGPPETYTGNVIYYFVEIKKKINCFCLRHNKIYT